MLLPFTLVATKIYSLFSLLSFSNAVVSYVVLINPLLFSVGNKVFPKLSIYSTVIFPFITSVSCLVSIGVFEMLVDAVTSLIIDSTLESIFL